jgi:hypothetical protein
MMGSTPTDHNRMLPSTHEGAVDRYILISTMEFHKVATSRTAWSRHC